LGEIILKSLLFNNITYQYNSDFKLYIKSFAIHSGQNYLIQGENGAGKTTLLKILCGQLEPSSIDLKIDDKHYNRFPDELKKNVGWIPSRDNGFFPRMTGIENIKLFSSMLSSVDIDERIEVWSSMKSFSKCLHKKYNDFSTGMRQVFQIFCLTLHQPQFVFLDEPFRGLDKTTKTELENILFQQETERSFIVTTHQLADFSFLDGEIVYMQGGKVVS
jgi:ABC-type multidrug transport system ATPase subunit